MSRRYRRRRLTLPIRRLIARRRRRGRARPVAKRYAQIHLARARTVTGVAWSGFLHGGRGFKRLHGVTGALAAYRLTTWCPGCQRTVRGHELPLHRGHFAPRNAAPGRRPSPTSRPAAPRPTGPKTTRPATSSAPSSPKGAPTMTSPTSAPRRPGALLPEAAAVVRASSGISQWDPRAVAELDAQLVSISRMLPAMGDDLLMWGEQLVARRAHRDVTGGVADLAAELAQLGASAVRITKRLRQLYAGQQAQEQSGVAPMRVA